MEMTKLMSQLSSFLRKWPTVPALTVAGSWRTHTIKTILRSIFSSKKIRFWIFLHFLSKTVYFSASFNNRSERLCEEKTIAVTVLLAIYHELFIYGGMRRVLVHYSIFNLYTNKVEHFPQETDFFIPQNWSSTQDRKRDRYS